MKWKGSAEYAKNGSRILIEANDRLVFGTVDYPTVIIDNKEFHFSVIDKWMYESEAKQILFEHSYPNLKYEEDQ
jgi:hypothetical protein